jgi:hypothetical protein
MSSVPAQCPFCGEPFVDFRQCEGTLPSALQPGGVAGLVLCGALLCPNDHIVTTTDGRCPINSASCPALMA